MTEPVFFPAARRFSVGEIATLTEAQLRDPATAETEISRLAPASEGGAETLVFVDGQRAIARLAEVAAEAVLCRPDVAERVPGGIAVLMTRAPQRAFVQIARLLFPTASRLGPISGETGISQSAHIAADARIEAGAIIEAGALIGPGAEIGRGSVIGPGAAVGANCRIGRDCHVGHGVTLQYALVGDRVILHPGARIGQDGFGYMPGTTGLEKVPQLGRVIIQNDVEIGANTTIDRGALSDTVIGEGSKIDNLVQIAHNVRIGRSCVVAGLCGLSGSVTLGDRVMLGGGVGIADHVTIGAGAQVAGRSGVMSNIPAGERWGGSPAQPYREALREIAAVRGLAKKKGSGNPHE